MQKIGYLILAHADPAHLLRLVNAINYHATFFIHIDAKSDIKKFQKLSLPSNTVFVQDRVSVAWGGISMISATLKLIEEALNSGEDFSHLVLLSGADYPIKTKSTIYKLLTSQPNREFIRYIDMRESLIYRNHIYQKWFKEPLVRTNNKSLQYVDKIVRSIGNKLRLSASWDPSIIPYFGSQWWALTPVCAEYILKFVKDNPDYFNKNINTFSPDEHFFHTIIGNSVFKTSSDGVQRFEGRGTWRLANLHLIHHSLTKWYTKNDWEDIETSDKLFVRKVNSDLSSELLDMIDDKILQITRTTLQ